MENGKWQATEIARTLPRPCNDVGGVALRALCAMENGKPRRLHGRSRAHAMTLGVWALRPLRSLCETLCARCPVRDALCEIMNTR